MPKNGVIYCSKSCADHHNVKFAVQHFQEAQEPISQYARHSVNFESYQDDEEEKRIPFSGDHNSTFEHLHGAIQLKPTQGDRAYTPMLDIYLNSSKSNQLQNVPSPKRRTSKPRPPPKPSMKQNYSFSPSSSSNSAFNGDRMVTIEEKLENIELREEPANVPPPVSRNTPPQPAPRKRKGILKQPKVDFDSNFERHAKGYSSCRESSSHKKSPRKISGYQSEMDPNAARSKTCSKRHMRRTKSTEMISRKDRLYFEDGQPWCSTCTSSSDDSDYDRWDIDDSSTYGQTESVEERLARSRPVPNNASSSKSSKSAKKNRKKHPKLRHGPATSPTLLFYDNHPDFQRPDWLLDTPPVTSRNDYPAMYSAKKIKKKRKKCVVQ